MPKRLVTAADLLTFQFVGDSQLSPDGSAVLFSKRHIDDKNAYVTNLFSVDVRTREVRQWTQGTGGAGAGRWSSDGSRIAFIGGRDKPGAQIYVLSTAGGEARKLTTLPEGSIGALMWSPDGRSIAFLFRESHPARTEAAKKERTEKGQSDPPWEIDTLFYKMDGDGYFGGQRFKLYVCDTETGEYRELYAKDPLGFYSFDWLPDSSGLVVAHSAAKDPLLDKPNDQLFIVPLKGRAKAVSCNTKGQKGSPRVSPDGKTVAYIGSDRPEDPWGVHNLRLWTLPLAGGEARCLTAGDDVCLDVLTLSDTMLGHTADGGGSGLVQWSPDGKRIFVSVGWEGSVDVGIVDVKKGGITMVTKGEHVVIGCNLSKDASTMAVTFGDALKLMEVGVLDTAKGTVKPLTSFNAAVLDGLELSKPKSVRIASTNGVKVQAWVMAPTGAKKDKAGRSAVVLEIHGGPHAQYGWSFFHEFQVLCSEGYTVVFSNPRGSKGYGEEFCAAIRGDWGNKDWDDVSAVKDWIKKQAWADPARLGVMGGSYGGYMTNWAVSHTHDFKAAITDRCVFNWLSMAGNSDFPLNKDGYFGGQAWGPLDKIGKLWQQSPISHFASVKTPMLIIHSEGDYRCHVEQSEQVFYVLKSLGVETRYVRFPVSTSHGLSRGGPPDLRIHRLNEITAWWRRYLVK
ncbi:MAG: S9 family peptidase [Armatimonadetes bacterium]|nr:S9 family peptidase [Armatimonadota bacterium]